MKFALNEDPNEVPPSLSKYTTDLEGWEQMIDSAHPSFKAYSTAMYWARVYEFRAIKIISGERCRAPSSMHSTKKF